MFSHQKLRVYGKAVGCVRRLTQHAGSWDKRHAVVGQVVRASESVLLNLAEGARLWTPASKRHALDYAIGSALECAACLDIAVIKCFVSCGVAVEEKRAVREVVRMLVGLRQAWEGNELREEDDGCYGQEEKALFAHERLEGYQVALEFMRWFHGLPAGPEMSNRVHRQVDKAAASVVLNLAEANGRYPEGERRNFLDIAESSAVKAAAYLDLCQDEGELEAGEKERGIGMLSRAAVMIRGLAGR